MSSQEDRHWEPFLNEDDDEESNIDKLQSVETNQQSNAEPKVKELKTDAKHDKDEEAILENDSDQGELML